MDSMHTTQVDKIGLPPGTPVHVGKQRTTKVITSFFGYDAKKLTEGEGDRPEKWLRRAGEKAVTWINLSGVHDVEQLQQVGDHFKLHPLILEALANTAQRPKCDQFGDMLFVVVKMLKWDVKRRRVRPEQVSFVLGDGFLLTFQEERGDVFDQIRERIRNDQGRVRNMGADYLLYALLDAIVDHYFVALERLGDRIETLDEKQTVAPNPEIRRGIRTLKRQLMICRHALWPMRDVTAALERGKNTLIGEETGIYVRDLYDHSVQVIETVETYRDILQSMLDIYLSNVSNRMNDVMKVLTIIATIFIPLTFIAGVYGMNFKHMPELYWPVGYWLCLGLMVAVAACMIVYFKRKKWM